MPFPRPTELPQLMVAPNGARRTKADHPAIPVTIAETVETAIACRDAGAGAMHFHVRDARQRHVLDAGLYREALAELERAVPEMHLQVTTEAVKHYRPEQMRRMATELLPPGISIALTEMMPNRRPDAEDIRLYKMLHEAGTRVQHILFYPEEARLLAELLEAADLPTDDLWCLFCIGHYTGRVSHPDLIAPFVISAMSHSLSVDWAICAFAEEENECLAAAVAQGGKIRVGFENSLLMPDGSIAPDNAARVAAANRLFADKGPVF